MSGRSKIVVRALKELADTEIAKHSQRFFKTGKGQYGEGDKFLGIRVPLLRKQATRFQALPLAETETLLASPYHEARLCALLIWVKQFQKGDEETRSKIYKSYLKHTKHINNWDLVDTSAHKIVGGYLQSRSRRPLYRLVKSKSLWERRIAIIATAAFIDQGDFDDTIALSELLLDDKEDLIHKAVGWMLREVGNRKRPVEEAFLANHYQGMPRTMLRYAIEKFPERRREQYLKGRV